MSKGAERLYYEDSYRVEFEAQVVERLSVEQKPAVVLDRTCFYPESGGQPQDRGLIEGVEVIRVLEDDERVIHVLAKDISGQRVKGKIDWPTRFDHMQQHSGQHILSQSFYELLQAETLSFHIGEESSTVEIDLRNVEDRELERVEKRANEVVIENREIKTYFVPEEEVKNIPLRKPPKKEGVIRVVEVSGFDYSACGGTHLRRTGEVGLVKIIGWERIRDNIRFEFVCGRRAAEDYSWKNRMIIELSRKFTAHQKEILSSVDKVFSELKSLRKANKKMQERMAQYEAAEIVEQAKEKVIKKIFVDRTAEGLKLLALNIIRKGDYAVLFGLKGEGRANIILACSEDLKLDMRELLPLVSSIIKGKGGGQASLVEVAGEIPQNIDQALDEAQRYLKEKI